MICLPTKNRFFTKPSQQGQLVLAFLLLAFIGEAQKPVACPTWYNRTNIAYRVDSLFAQRQPSDTGNNQNPTSITTFKTLVAGVEKELSFYVYIETTINDKSLIRVRSFNFNDKTYKGATVDTIQLPRSDGNYHVCPTVGVDSLGYIHVTADMHNGYWRYFRSKKPLDIASGFDNISSTLNKLAVGITYPTIFYDNNRGMYLLFRHLAPEKSGNTSIVKGSGNHRIGIMKYNAYNKTFTILGGKNYKEKDGTPSTTTTMGWANGHGGHGGWYIKPGHRIYFDGNNRMHFIATVIGRDLGDYTGDLKYNIDSLIGGFESNTHILYAYSDDFGKTWYKAGGAKIDSLPLTPTNASIAVNRYNEHDIIGGECELGALDKNTPIITYKLYSDNTKNAYHAIKWNGTAWEEFCLPVKTNIFMCRNINDTTAYAAWYDGYTFAYTKDCKNWVVTSEADAQKANNDSNFTGLTDKSKIYFPDGLKDISATGLDREYFKKTGNFRFEGTYNTYTLHNIYTMYTYVGDSIRDKSLSTLQSTTKVNAIAQYTNSIDNVSNSCTVYPNPLHNTANLMVRLNNAIVGQTYQIQVFNTLGQLVYSHSITAANAGHLEQSVNYNIFSKGIFSVNVSLKGQSICASKLIVQ